MRELSVEEVGEVSGGEYTPDWSAISAGVGAIALGTAILSVTGLAAVPILFVGAATSGELMVTGSAMALAAGGGYAIGTGTASGKDDEDS